MISHTDFIHKVMSDEQYSKEYEVSVQTMPNGAVIRHPDKYKPEYDKLSFEAMASDNGTLTSCCAAIHCTKSTILNWIKRHPSLRESIEKGRIIGEEKFRKKIREHAFEPTGNVNNGLIKMLGRIVHGIDAEEAPTVIINNNNRTLITDEETASLYKDAIENRKEIE